MFQINKINNKKNPALYLDTSPSFQKLWSGIVIPVLTFIFILIFLKWKSIVLKMFSYPMNIIHFAENNQHIYCNNYKNI